MTLFKPCSTLTAAVLLTLSALPSHAESSFAQVHAVVFDSPQITGSTIEQQERAVYAAGQLPQYPVTAGRMVVDGVNLLRRDAVVRLDGERVAIRLVYRHLHRLAGSQTAQPRHADTVLLLDLLVILRISEG